VGLWGREMMRETTRFFFFCSAALNAVSELYVNQNVASKYISQWTSLSGSSSVGHLESVYGDTASWGLMYNLFADKWMGTGLVGDDVSAILLLGAMVLISMTGIHPTNAILC